ncbi:iron uptake protein [Massilia sp. CFBP9012]|uniref:iron uptake protein n=1 Tax=Massilia sp. CFBP9012 TaxID=3096531 RepID=UPI002A6A68FD|nr:iron uptake protein [Massilia sp. CFBP9012]MDY0976217.1 iron uptake protein [Massilia sp. CFBP9012]
MRSASERGLRIVGAVVGGYLLTVLTVIAAGAVLARLGMARSEAVALSSMLGFVFYLALLVWAFSVRPAARLWIVLAAGVVLTAAVIHVLD